LWALGQSRVIAPTYGGTAYEETTLGAGVDGVGAGSAFEVVFHAGFSV